MQSSSRYFRFPFGTVVLVSLVALVTSVAQADPADPAGRVGRISFASGDVQFFADADTGWQPGYLNEPVGSRSSIFTGADGRTEIRFSQTAVALSADSQIDIEQLDDTTFLANVVKGSVSVDVRRRDSQELDTVSANGSQFTVLGPGRYRFEAAADGFTATATVLNGRLNALAAGSALPIDSGTAMTIVQSDTAPADFQAAQAQLAELDDWTHARQSRLVAADANHYVSPNMTGYEELEANGRWDQDPTYGTVWYPTAVVADWVPYRYGHWAFAAPWGWTWVDDAPWGFAPFHYGRWVVIGSSWAWVPGTYTPRPVFAPALVGFVGEGSITVGFGAGAGPGVGWYPLAPWERYRPVYTQNAAYVASVNNIRLTSAPPGALRVVNNVPLSQNQLAGATVVSRDTFAGSHPVARANMEVAPQTFARGSGPTFAPAVARPAVVAPLAQPYTRSAPARTAIAPPGAYHGGALPSEYSRIPTAPVRTDGFTSPNFAPRGDSNAREVDPRRPQAMPSPDFGESHGITGSVSTQRIVPGAAPVSAGQPMRSVPPPPVREQAEGPNRAASRPPAREPDKDHPDR